MYLYKNPVSAQKLINRSPLPPLLADLISAKVAKLSFLTCL